MIATPNVTFSDFSVQYRQLDWNFVTLAALIVSFGLVMVASSSVDFAASEYGDMWMFARKQVILLLLGIVLGFLILHVPSAVWNQYSIVFLILSFALLMLVLIPGIGKVVNGSRRWFSFGPIGFQASELSKFCLLIFYASFLERHSVTGRVNWTSFSILIGIIVLTAILLLLEPDFGSCVILCLGLGTMVFISGVPFLRFVALAGVALATAQYILESTPWRKERLTSYLDPFADPYDKGYQLVNSLIAFGRGEWTGLGLGNSIQKLFFLPDAHTDFIFAIIFEEFGLIGSTVFILIYAIFIASILKVGLSALNVGMKFGGYLCTGIAAVLGSQAFINMGVATGLLPTKGLTLPLISYGGSSLLVTCLLLALVLRIKMEVNNAK